MSPGPTFEIYEASEGRMVIPAQFGQALRYFSMAMREDEPVADIRVSASLPMAFSPLDRPQIQMTSRAVQIDGFQMWSSRTSTGFNVTPTEALDAFMICLPEKGSLIRHWSRGETKVGAGSISFSYFPDFERVEVLAGFEAIGVTIDARELRAQLVRLEGDASAISTFAPVVALDTLPMKALARTIQALYARLHLRAQTDDLVSPLLREILLNQIIAAWHRDAPPEAAASEDTAPHHLRRALDFIKAHLAEPFTVADIAAAAGTSVRTLQISFRRELQMSPVPYVLGLRLDRAHADLLRGGTGQSVSQIAYHWGFLHMSDFSRRYRDRFGCTPSETRRDR